jgi:hypothetical protein
VFLNHKMLQIFFICFYFVGPHIEQRWRCYESFIFITLKSSGLFWVVGYPKKNLPIQSFFQISLSSHSCLPSHHCQLFSGSWKSDFVNLQMELRICRMWFFGQTRVNKKYSLKEKKGHCILPNHMSNVSKL